jgi:cyclopropane fatty-acyl-phospholipid synthase-like methyltransferase
LSEILKAVRLVGAGQMLKLGRGYRAGWDELFRGYMAMRCMHALLATGFLDELIRNPGASPDAYAKSKDLDGDVLRPLCEALYADGLLERKDQGFELGEKGSLIVETLRGWLEVSYGYSELFDSLVPMMERKKLYGKDFYRKSDYVATGSGEMENWLFFPQANEIVLSKGYKNVLDLGCGDGTFLRKLCALNKEVTCFGIDLAPEAIEEGKRRAQAAGLGERISLYAADIQDVREMPDALRAVEVATIFFVLHEILYLGEDRVIAFLKAFRDRFPGVPLIAFEAIRPSAEVMRQRRGIAIYYYLYHDLSHQKPASREKWKELFRASGFKSIEERHMDFARTAIYTLA